MTFNFKKVSSTITEDIEGLGLVTMEIDDYSVEDDGIGGYEFHGSCGYDSRPYVEVNSVNVLAINNNYEHKALESVRKLINERINNRVYEIEVDEIPY